MKTLDFFKGDNSEVVVALGFFDSIHVGHATIINKAKEIAKTHMVDCAVFTFLNDIDCLFKNSSGLVLTYDERIEKLSKLSVNTVISTIFTKEFSNISATEFFNVLTSNFAVKAVVCGRDYRFGHKGMGDVNLLNDLCQEKGISLHVVDDVSFEGKRVSTTNIKELLLNGRLQEANELLGEVYSISGEVVHGRAVGTQIGFPTANVIIPSEKAKIKTGVYKTHVVLDGKVYRCITNYGARPTFNLDEVLTETYVDSFSGNLYGRKITICFDAFLRDCKKFNSIIELTNQLKLDLEKIK